MLFVRQGYDAVTTRMIADTAGIKFGSLYHFFPNKEAILAGLAARHLAAQKHMQQAMEELEDTTSLKAYLDVLVEKMAAHFEQHTPFERIVNSQSSSPELLAYAKKFEEEALEQIIKNITQVYPHIPLDTAKLEARVSFALAQSLLSISVSANDNTRTIIRRNIKAALYAIWQPLVVA